MHIQSKKNPTIDDAESKISDTNILFQRYSPMMHQKNRGDKLGE